MHFFRVAFGGLTAEPGGDGEHFFEHFLAFYRFGLAVHCEVEQGDRLHHHVERVDENHAPATVMLHHKQRETLVLQGVEHHVMHRDSDGGHQDGEPVAVERQHRQQREDTEVRFDDALGLVDVQCRHHHQADAKCATHQAGAADDAVGQGKHHAGAAAYEERLQQRVVPERQAQGEEGH